MDSRRDFIKKATLLSGAFALPNVIPMSIQKAMAISADPGSTFYDAEHIVFLMQHRLRSPAVCERVQHDEL